MKIFTNEQIQKAIQFALDRRYIGCENKSPIYMRNRRIECALSVLRGFHCKEDKIECEDWAIHYGLPIGSILYTQIPLSSAEAAIALKQIKKLLIKSLKESQ